MRIDRSMHARLTAGFKLDFAITRERCRSELVFRHAVSKTALAIRGKGRRCCKRGQRCGALSGATVHRRL